ncbi:protein kinase superfamily protein [Actinidia rufa]|uniref:Protein kinase superfamily protein n=1 Tax=Actinidia rufa TaxID=165716 RepID=A0A7J0H2D2_9ERIC|nr:protein kinase superfamily protein [Actinidia rufa]
MVFKRKYKELYGDGQKWFRGDEVTGKASSGRVHLATLKKPKWRLNHLPTLMVVKSTKISNSALLQKEADVLKDLQGCPYICRCFGDEITAGENNRMIYNLLLEYGKGGTLAEVIKKSGGCGLPKSDVKRYTRYILEGLTYIHDYGYVHCDLKPENIIIVPKFTCAGTEYIAKISDFEWVKSVRQDEKKREIYSDLFGTLRYLSPERVVEKRQEAPGDIWALGCIVVEMLTGKSMWDGKKDSEVKKILYEIEEGNRVIKIPSGVSKEARDFLKGLDEEQSIGDVEKTFCCYEVNDAESSCSFADPSKMRMKKRKVDSSSSCLSDE